jgi:hypothetical protein
MLSPQKSVQFQRIRIALGFLIAPLTLASVLPATAEDPLHLKGRYGCKSDPTQPVLIIKNDSIEGIDAQNGSSVFRYSISPSRSDSGPTPAKTVYGTYGSDLFGQGFSESIHVKASYDESGKVVGLFAETPLSRILVFDCKGSDLREFAKGESLSEFDRLLEYIDGYKRDHFSIKTDGNTLKIKNGDGDRVGVYEKVILRKTYRKYHNGSVSFLVGAYSEEYQPREEEEVFLNISEEGKIRYLRLRQRRWQLGQSAFGWFRSTPTFEVGDFFYAKAHCDDWVAKLPKARDFI